MISMKQIRRRKWWLGVALALSRGMVRAQEPSTFDVPPKSDAPAPTATKPMPPTLADKIDPYGGKRVVAEMRDRPWPQVFEWLQKETNLPVMTAHKPTGSFTFISSPAGRAYTIPEWIDNINNALQDEHYLLYRRE